MSPRVLPRRLSGMAERRPSSASNAGPSALLVGEPLPMGSAMSPKWQKARMVEHPDYTLSAPAGTEVWVLVGPPTCPPEGFRDCLTRASVQDALAYPFNVTRNHAPGLLCMIAACTIELLARGPEDFAEDVDILIFEDWIAQCQDLGPDEGPVQSQLVH